MKNTHQRVANPAPFSNSLAALSRCNQQLSTTPEQTNSNKTIYQHKIAMLDSKRDFVPGPSNNKISIPQLISPSSPEHKTFDDKAAQLPPFRKSFSADLDNPYSQKSIPQLPQISLNPPSPSVKNIASKPTPCQPEKDDIKVIKSSFNLEQIKREETVQSIVDDGFGRLSDFFNSDDAYNSSVIKTVICTFHLRTLARLRAYEEQYRNQPLNIFSKDSNNSTLGLNEKNKSESASVITTQKNDVVVIDEDSDGIEENSDSEGIEEVGVTPLPSVNRLNPLNSVQVFSQPRVMNLSQIMNVDNNGETECNNENITQNGKRKLPSRDGADKNTRDAKKRKMDGVEEFRNGPQKRDSDKRRKK
eukprot:TRINITY_DN6602_c0_g1_i2.p1 TRINITY_DN6602_c0_g1~~TRINITY_DN6602_c0_g1_i2.p1  ORF type:complete len:360 (-),score=63.40 TRINITY_DN6602_c0_g1_i2:119-1198(-)